MHEIYIGIKGFFICGLPSETDETMRETINWAKDLKQKWGKNSSLIFTN